MQMLRELHHLPLIADLDPCRELIRQYGCANMGAVVSPSAPVWPPESVRIRGQSPGKEIRRTVPPRIGAGALEFGASGRKQVDFITRDQRICIVDFSHFAYI